MRSACRDTPRAHPAILRVRVADHREQRLGLLLAIDGPLGIEDLVAACSEFACANIMTPRRWDRVSEPRSSSPGIDLIVRRASPSSASPSQCLATGGPGDTFAGTRGFVREQRRGLAAIQQRRLGLRSNSGAASAAAPRATLARVFLRQRTPRSMRRPASRPHTWHVGGLLDQGRDGPKLGDDDDSTPPSRRCAPGIFAGPRSAAAEQLTLAPVPCHFQVDEMQDRAIRHRCRAAGLRAPAQLGDAEIGYCLGAGSSSI